MMYLGKDVEEPPAVTAKADYAADAAVVKVNALRESAVGTALRSPGMWVMAAVMAGVIFMGYRSIR